MCVNGSASRGVREKICIYILICTYTDVIGIKYGPEGRVANKAEELMSTRSRRKAPRTG